MAPSSICETHTCLTASTILYLTNEAVDVLMSEVFGEDMLLKRFDIIDDELGAVVQPVNDLVV